MRRFCISTSSSSGLVSTNGCRSRSTVLTSWRSLSRSVGRVSWNLDKCVEDLKRKLGGFTVCVKTLTGADSGFVVGSFNCRNAAETMRCRYRTFARDAQRLERTPECPSTISPSGQHLDRRDANCLPVIDATEPYQQAPAQSSHRDHNGPRRDGTPVLLLISSVAFLIWPASDGDGTLVPRGQKRSRRNGSLKVSQERIVELIYCKSATATLLKQHQRRCRRRVFSQASKLCRRAFQARRHPMSAILSRFDTLFCWSPMQRLQHAAQVVHRSARNRDVRPQDRVDVEFIVKGGPYAVGCQPRVAEWSTCRHQKEPISATPVRRGKSRANLAETPVSVQRPDWYSRCGEAVSGQSSVRSASRNIREAAPPEFQEQRCGRRLTQQPGSGSCRLWSAQAVACTAEVAEVSNLLISKRPSAQTHL